MATKDQWVECAGGLGAAIELETALLSSRCEFLPDCALVVLRGDEAPEGYWDWLIEQAQMCREGREIQARSLAQSLEIAQQRAAEGCGEAAWTEHERYSDTIVRGEGE